MSLVYCTNCQAEMDYISSDIVTTFEILEEQYRTNYCCPECDTCAVFSTPIKEDKQ